jgi:protein-tyrosine phosphatase
MEGDRMLERGLGLAGAPNARDLGGLVTVDGRRVREGVLLRSGALGRLRDQDLTALADRKLAYVVDLRDRSEIAAAPPDRLPAGPAPVVRHIPVFDPRHPVFTYVSAVLMGHDVSAEAPPDGSPGAMLAIYRWMVADAGARAGFAAAFRVIVEAAGEPLLYHCSAGKDRTGWLSAVILSVLGVDRATILADYLATNEYSRVTNETVIGAMRARGRVAHPEVVLPVFEAREEYLAAAYAEADRQFGGMAGYLREGLGIDDQLSDTVRDLLLHGR